MRRLIPVGLAVALVAAACGGGDDTAASKKHGTTTTSAPAPTTTTRAGDLNAARVTLTKVADVTAGTALAVRRDNSTLYVAEQRGRIVAIRDGQVDPTPALDITGDIQAGGEQGLLGIAFSPDGTKLYVHSTAPGGDTRLQEFAFTNGHADASTARTLLTAPGLQPNHNGGQLAFGPDGMLYMGIGDGGNRDDVGSGHAPIGNGQSLDTLLGKILRIDPHATGDAAYRIPPDNPFARGGGRPEIWAYGLRNPWRFSFDRSTGDLWIADVGQDKYEEIDFAPAPRHGRGANFGWNITEGFHPLRGGVAAGPTIAPVLETSHADGNCSITGGYVYREKNSRPRRCVHLQRLLQRRDPRDHGREWRGRRGSRPRHSLESDLVLRSRQRR